LQHGHNFYEYKIKHFLTDSALGMTGSKVWLGAYDITGGYLIVKKDGDVLCYHVYNRNQFEDYLFANTKLDTPSSTRHEFGTVYEENEQLYFALNLQIRFK
jgi:HpaII restriction endonuclease